MFFNEIFSNIGKCYEYVMHFWIDNQYRNARILTFLDEISKPNFMQFLRAKMAQIGLHKLESHLELYSKDTFKVFSAPSPIYNIKN